MSKRLKILVIAAGMGLVNYHFATGAANAIPVAATDRRYWKLPEREPLPKAPNVPYYRRYDRKRHR